MKVKLDRDEEVETDDLTLQSLEQLTNLIIEASDQIAGTWDSTRRRAASEGELADPDWFNRLSHKKRGLNRARQQLVTELARRKKQERMERSAEDRVPYYLMMVAKERLSDTLFDELMAEALRRFNNSQAGWKVSAHFLFEKD